MASQDESSLILAILKREKACHYPELVNRAYKELGFPSFKVSSACTVLGARGDALSKKVQANDLKKTNLSFVCSKYDDPKNIDAVIDYKTKLLERHYNLSDTVGHHGEAIVGQVCKEAGYTDIEIRKEKHGEKDLGISKRDIDVFGKHPSGTYYQNIEVKNRRDPVKDPELATIADTTRIAEATWKLTIKPALVATFAHETTTQTAKTIGLPIAFSGGVYVPEKYRPLYEELNEKVALNVIIADIPGEVLRRNLRAYIVSHKY